MAPSPAHLHRLTTRYLLGLMKELLERAQALVIAASAASTGENGLRKTA